ncbi:MAG: 16S rRNA (guanine(966)-N(2))-methyltransferase RsmD [Lentisphaerae bacterium]|nr:16S rRNA (guanine(966)-N(2))-methyltransferase RsmD [Lentisphaerota bacterium]
MRIAGGEFGGRTLLVPKTGDIRPTQDRVREALFSMLMTEVPGCSFLDLFAGSGGVGLEALSRGAARATFVERDPRHAGILRKNIEALYARREGGAASAPASVVVADAYRFIRTFSGASFDIAFADPPYALGEEKGYVDFLNALAEHEVVRRGGCFVAEMTARQPPDGTQGWTLARDRQYGKTRLCIWRRDAR